MTVHLLISNPLKAGQVLIYLVRIIKHNNRNTDFSIFLIFGMNLAYITIHVILSMSLSMPDITFQIYLSCNDMIALLYFSPNYN